MNKHRCPLCLTTSSFHQEGKVCKNCLARCQSVFFELANESTEVPSDWFLRSKSFFRFALFIEDVLPDHARALRAMIGQLSVARYFKS